MTAPRVSRCGGPRVAIVGAGIAGLVNARVLRPLGVDVVVFEARADIGGVWSSTRGYPGQRLQNDKRTYALSELPMPAHYPENPNRAEVQAYLVSYATAHGLHDLVRLSTTVTRAAWDAGTEKWTIRADGPDGPVEDCVDWLIVANGTLSTPNPPRLDGAEAFTAAGGRIVDASSLREDADLGGRVVVLGYGKSATDIALAAAERGAAVTVLARSVPWKLPYRIGPLPFQWVVSSRLGEHLMWAPYRTMRGRVLRRADTLVRWGFQAALTQRIRRQLRLDRRGLVPHRSIRAVTHLVTPGFHEAVDTGAIDLRVGARIERLAGEDGPTVHLHDGSVLPADLLVAATGYRTDVSFLDDRTQRLLHDDDGSMPLHRHTAPPRVPRLAFAGWINSFRSPIASELQALWIAALVHGAIAPGTRSRGLRGLLPSADHPTRPGPAGLPIVDQDAWLQEAGLSLPRSTRLRELVLAVDPADYAGLHDQLQARLRDTARIVVHRPPMLLRGSDALRRMLRAPRLLHREPTRRGRPR